MQHKKSEFIQGTELARLKSNQRVRVCEITGGWQSRQRVNQMGIHIGDVMIIRQAGAFKGPVLVEVHGTQVALGCGMARKVIVQPIGEDK